MLLRPTNFFLLLIAVAFGLSLGLLRAAQLGPGAPVTQSQPPVAQNSSVYPIEGVVINAVTSGPVGNALVQITVLAEHRSLLTKPDGKFHFDNVPAGQLRITVQKPGFFSEQQITEAGRLSAPLEVGPSMTPVILKLVPEGVIYGRITDAAGEAVENIVVDVFYAAIVDGRRAMRQQFNTFTDTDGEFRMFELRPGMYYLSAGRFTTTFYQGVRDIHSATPIRIAPAQQIRVDLQVQPDLVYQISGIVSGVPPGANANLEVITQDVAGNGSGKGFALQRDGSFTEVVPAGSYMLQARAAKGNGEELAASLPLQVTSDASGMQLVLAPTATIPVNVDFELVRHVNPELPNGRPAVTVTLVPKDGSFRNRYSTNDVRMLGSSLEPRSLAVRNVETGVYSVELDKFGPWYVAVARRGTTDLLAQDLVVDSGGVGEPIEITVRDDFASIQGSVTSDGQPTQGSVLLIPQRDQQRALMIPVDGAGHFQMDSVAPGEYTAFAFDRIENLEYRNPEAMREYASGAQVVRLLPGGDASVNLQLQKRREY